MKVLASPSSPTKPQDNKQVAIVAKSSDKLLLCLFLCLSMVMFWQIYLFSRIQFTSSTDFVLESRFDSLTKTLPAMTFCTNIGQMNANHSQEMFEYWKAEDMVSYISIKSEDNQRETFITDQYMPHTIQSISYKYYCFTLNSKVRGLESLELRNDDRLFVKFAKSGVYKSWWIYLSNGYDIPNSYEWNAVELKGGTNTITYRHQSYRLNERSQMCRNFGRDFESDSRKECIRKCKLSKSISECGVIYDGIDVRSDEFVMFAKTWTDKSCAAGKDFDLHCHYMCPTVDCVKDYYQLQIIETGSSYYDQPFLQFIIPKEPEATHIQKPLIEAKEIIYFWASTLTVWFTLLSYLIYSWSTKDLGNFVVLREKFSMIQSKISDKFGKDMKAEDNQKV